MKIDKRKNYYIVLDTEGLGLNNIKEKLYGQQKTYDIGYVIIDKKGNVQKKYSALVEKIFGEYGLTEEMETAYFADKVPLYQFMIDDKEIKVKKFRNIINQLKRDIKAYKPKGIFAYNCNYDIVALAETTQASNIKNKPKLQFRKTKNGKWQPLFEKYLQSLLETKIEFFDIWTMACMTLCQQKTFLAQAKFTSKGNIITNAETVYQYITQNDNFIEEHTALADAEIEAQILARIFANGCKPTKQIFFPFRLIPIEKEKVA